MRLNPRPLLHCLKLGKKLDTGEDGHGLQRHPAEGAHHKPLDAALRPLASRVAHGVPEAAEDPDAAKRGTSPREHQARDEEGAEEGGDVLGVVRVGPLCTVKCHRLGILVGLLGGRVRVGIGDAARLSGSRR